MLLLFSSRVIEVTSELLYWAFSQFWHWPHFVDAWDGDVDGLAYRGLYIYQLLFPFFVESYIFFLPQMQRFCEWLLVLVQLAMC